MNRPRFDEQLVVQLILVFSCCVFSIAAENRFISHSEINSQEENKALNNSERLLENYSKELSLQKHLRILYSERVHLKAIEVLFFGVDPNSKLFQHFLQSYKQNYDFNMHMIQEVEEPSVTSVKNSEYFGQGFLLQVMKKNPEIERQYQKIVMSKQREKLKKMKNQFQIPKTNKKKAKGQ